MLKNEIIQQFSVRRVRPADADDFLKPKTYSPE